MSRGEPAMRCATLTLLAVVALGLGASGQALGQNKLDYPKEAFGFRGTLSGEVVKVPDKVYGWFEIKVVKVVSFSSGNRTRVTSPRALTEVWKDKCVAVLGVKGMAELKLGDRVTVTVYNREVHLRASKVTKEEPGEARPDGAGTPEAGKTADERAEAYLKYARKLLDQGMTDRAKERLKEVVEKFPTTKSGEEAKKLLEKLDKGPSPAKP